MKIFNSDSKICHCEECASTTKQSTLSFRGRQPEESHGITTKRFFAPLRMTLGFTLAEVLITLTIIGVIAAMTIPNLMHKHLQKELEASFNKSIALLNQGLSLMAYEEGAGLKQSYATSNKETGLYSGDKNFSNFPNYLKIEKQMYIRDLHAKIGDYKNYNKTNTLSQILILSAPKRIDKIYVTPNGMTFRPTVESSQINILVDTNGTKGPNRAGYDYFWFVVSNQDRITYNNFDYSCSSTDNSNTNGLGCSKYALTNKCPDDEAKTYWECLK